MEAHATSLADSDTVEIPVDEAAEVKAGDVVVEEIPQGEANFQTNFRRC